MAIFDDTNCELGEGPLWHPLRNELFWFDILGMKLHSKGTGETTTWQFDEHVSAAGWIDEKTLLIASETCLAKFDIESGESEFVCALEADNPATRSNDGRADPWGGFWIGTMGKEAEHQAGAIYRYYRGELRMLFPNITITNAICFTPDRKFAYYTDTRTSIVMRQALDNVNGWPVGEPEVYIDFTDTDFHPDGAVCDVDGYFWNAQWGTGRVARFAPDGSFVSEVKFTAPQTTCPAFGGPDMKTLMVTSAAVGTEGDDVGRTFSVEVDVAGPAEPQVIL